MSYLLQRTVIVSHSFIDDIKDYGIFVCVDTDRLG